MGRVDYLNDPHAPRANRIVVATSVYAEDDAGRILMIRRSDNDLWSIPGGGIEIGETVTACAVRETKEETGVDVTVTGLVGIFTNPAHVVAYDDGEVRQQFSVCVRGRPVDGVLRVSDESTQVAWIDPEQLDALPVHPEIRRRIDAARSGSQTPHID